MDDRDDEPEGLPILPPVDPHRKRRHGLPIVWPVRKPLENDDDEQRGDEPQRVTKEP